MNTVTLTTLITIAGFVASVMTSIFIAGVRTGRQTKDIEYIRRDLDEIKQLFHLTLTSPPSGKIGP